MKGLFAKQETEITNKCLKICTTSNGIRGDKKGSNSENVFHVKLARMKKIEKLMLRGLCKQGFVQIFSPFYCHVTWLMVFFPLPCTKI